MRLPKFGIPRYQPLPPPGGLQKESFALPFRPTLLSGETDPERNQRIKVVRREAKRFYDAVARHLGEDDAGALFRLFASPAVRKRGKRADIETNTLLLETYDRKAISGASIPEAARALCSEHGCKFGASAEAIEKRIRRLVDLREQRRKKQVAREAARSKALSDAYRQQFGKEPTSLLGEAVSGLSSEQRLSDADI